MHVGYAELGRGQRCLQETWGGGEGLEGAGCIPHTFWGFWYALPQQGTLVWTDEQTGIHLPCLCVCWGEAIPRAESPPDQHPGRSALPAPALHNPLWEMSSFLLEKNKIAFSHPYYPQYPGTASRCYPLSFKILLHLDVFILVPNGGSTGHGEEEERKETPKHCVWWLQSAAKCHRAGEICVSAPSSLRSRVTFRPQRTGPAGRPAWRGLGR